jgi:DNA-binding transcriptional ArsR family regulator
MGQAGGMVWRIHFTDEDLARIQVSPTLGPLSETVLAMSLLRGGPTQSRSLFAGWRSQVGGKLTPQMKALTELIPAGSRGVDLCTLAGEAPTIEQGVTALLAVPREQMLVEMGLFDRWHRLPAGAWTLVEPGAREQLADAMQAAHRALIEPYWTRILACLEAEQVARRRTLTQSGPGRLLATLQGERIRWRPPVLEVQMPMDVDMYLEGRGLSLVPSVFVGKCPNLIHDPSHPSAAPRLILPAADERVRGGGLWDGPRSAKASGAALAALVGRNRAAVLNAVAGGCTTTELAGRVGISLAAASQHASVLRDAGLITSCRQGGAVLHALTPLGADLLQAG